MQDKMDLKRPKEMYNINIPTQTAKMISFFMMMCSHLKSLQIQFDSQWTGFGFLYLVEGNEITGSGPCVFYCVHSGLITGCAFAVAIKLHSQVAIKFCEMQHKLTVVNLQLCNL